MQRITFLWIFLCLLSTCQRGQSPSPSQEAEPTIASEELPTRRQLRQKLRELRRVILVYPEAAPAIGETLANGTKDLRGFGRWVTLEIKSDAELTLAELTSNIIYLMGTPSSNRHLQQLLPKLPLNVEQGGWRLGDERFAADKLTVGLNMFPNPLQPTNPLSVLLSNSLETINEHLISQFENGDFGIGGSGWGYEVYEQQRRTLMGNFNDQTWEMDGGVHFNFRKQPTTTAAGTLLEFVAHEIEPAPEQLAHLRQAVETNLQQLATFVERPLPTTPIPFHLYPDSETKGLMLSNTQQAHCAGGEVHQVIHSNYADHHPAAENELFLRTTFGEAKTIALEQGLRLKFAPGWQKFGAMHWAHDLYHADALPRLENLLDSDWYATTSTILNGAAATTVVEFLVEVYGKHLFLENYATWQPQPGELPKLQTQWDAWLLKTFGPRQSKKVSNTIPVFSINQRLQGFNFAHEGYQIYNGYGSREATKSIEAQIGLGANAIAIVPYTSQRDPKAPTTLFVSKGAGGENDEAVIKSALDAQQRGLYALLKPQIWVGGGSWPGDIEMATDADWQQWFASYEQWIVHYALLAQIHDLDALCLGVEFAKATLARPDDWRRVIEKVRGVFTGHLTYAANWGDEFEKLKFWDELDYIGLDCYYPLSADTAATRSELEAGWQDIMLKMERIAKQYDKQILLTEVGFRSVSHPWINPHAEANGRPFDGDAQALCYEIALAGLKDKDWCAGYLFWKFPSYMEHRGERNTAFAPCNKPAEAIVAKAFGKVN